MQSEYQRRLDRFNRNLINSLLDRHKGNISHVSEELGLPRLAIYRMCKKLNININNFRSREPIKIASI